MKKLFTTFVAITFAALSLNLHADEKDAKISDFKFGKTLQGDEPTEDSLKGKVVVIEYWGVNCPPCIAAMPHLAKLDKRYRDKGLVIIGAESQNSSAAAIKKITDKAKVEFAITAGANGPVAVRGIPKALIFDTTGKIIFNGNPADKNFDSTIKKALKDVKS